MSAHMNLTAYLKAPLLIEKFAAPLLIPAPKVNFSLYKLAQDKIFFYSRLLSNLAPKPFKATQLLLIGELYRFPLKAQIESYLQAHHLIMKKKKCEIGKIASLLTKQEAHSEHDLINLLKSVEADVKDYLPVLKEISNGRQLWIYNPRPTDRLTLAMSGWNTLPRIHAFTPNNLYWSS